jgi:penicillin-binding protein 2
MTFMFDPQKGLDALKSLEQQWGGTAQERLEQRYAAYARERGATVTPPPRRDEDIFDRVEAEARVAAQQSEEIADEFVAPRPIANPSGTPPPDARPQTLVPGIQTPATSSPAPPAATPAAGAN